MDSLRLRNCHSAHPLPSTLIPHLLQVASDEPASLPSLTFFALSQILCTTPYSNRSFPPSKAPINAHSHHVSLTLSLSLSLLGGVSFLFVSWPHGMACGSLVYCLGIELSSLALEVQNLNHWTIREVPCLLSWHPLLPLIFHSNQAESWKTWIHFHTLLFETLHWLCFAQVQRARAPPQTPGCFLLQATKLPASSQSFCPSRFSYPLPPILLLAPLEPTVRVPFSIRTYLNRVFPDHLPQSPTLQGLKYTLDPLSYSVTIRLVTCVTHVCSCKLSFKVTGIHVGLLYTHHLTRPLLQLGYGGRWLGKHLRSSWSNMSQSNVCRKSLKIVRKKKNLQTLHQDLHLRSC